MNDSKLERQEKKYMKIPNKKNQTIILTFFEKGFFNEVEVFQLTKTEKIHFLKDIVRLTPKERKILITKMKESYFFLFF